MSNKLIIAAAGSGKTTYLVNKAHEMRDKKILITTFTERNSLEIRQKFIDLYGCVDCNVDILPWISFLLKHGVRPYQSCYDPSLHDINIGFLLVGSRSGVQRYLRNGRAIYWGEGDFMKFYFSPDMKIYSDKISKFICETNRRSNNAIFTRLRKIYDAVFIDEIQDMVGYDLDIIDAMLKEFDSILLVGDPRQCTYSTHNAIKYKKYAEGNIEGFISEKLDRHIVCGVDKTSLCVSHRNFKEQCDLASSLYPQYPKSEPCRCTDCRHFIPEHHGLFCVKTEDIDNYLESTSAVQLRWDKSVSCSPRTQCFNMGEAKGMTFNHTMLYLTRPMIEWLKSRSSDLAFGARAKFYVALTRAKYSVAIVWDDDPSLVPEFKTF